MIFYIYRTNHIIYFTCIICVKKIFYSVSGLCLIMCKVTIKITVKFIIKKISNFVIVTVTKEKNNAVCYQTNIKRVTSIPWYKDVSSLQWDRPIIRKKWWVK